MTRMQPPHGGASGHDSVMVTYICYPGFLSPVTFCIDAVHTSPETARPARATMALKPLTNRSRDSLPNPSFSKNNQYVPTNSPALADLFDAFDFNGKPVMLPYTD